MDELRHDHHPATSGRGGRWLPLAVLMGLSLVAVAIFVVVRRAVDDQNGRILKERTGEVGLLLQSAVSDLSSAMQPLGVAQRLGGVQAFQQVADTETAIANTRTIALVRRSGGRLVVVAVSGRPVLSKGQTLSGPPAQAVASGIATGKLTGTTVFHSGSARLLGFALGPPTSAAGTAVLLLTRVDPDAAANGPVAQQAPFHELAVALFATGHANTSQLLLATAPTPLSGQTARKTVTVGNQRWLLVTSARQPLVGSFANAVPWIVLGVGLFGTLVATGVVLMFQRRRNYALALVDARTAQLNASVEELEDAQARLVFQERLAAIGQVAAAVGHELRNPLGVLTNSLYLIRSTISSGDEERVERHLATADREIAAAVVIVEGLLDFARQSAPDPDMIDLADLVDESLSVATAPAGVEVVRIGLDGFPRVRVDRQQMRQVLLNLLTNAYAAMDGQGVLTVEAVPFGETVEIKVSDTGSGMDEETANHIFDPFFTRKAKGIGLGLAVTRRIVAAHGGTIAVESKPDIGTTFVIDLPGALVAAEEVAS
jgi:signal transduction histidine kinase